MVKMLTLEEIDLVSGGWSQQACHGAYTMAGGLLGMGIGALFDGIGAAPGVSIGIGLGSALGDMMCGGTSHGGGRLQPSLVPIQLI